MAILSTNTVFLIAGGFALVGGAWAFSGSLENSAVEGAETTYEAAAPGDDSLSDVRPALNPELQKSSLQIDIEKTSGRRAAQNRAIGMLILSNDKFKGFGNDNQFGGSGGVGSSTLDRAAVAAEGERSVEPVNLNENHEIIYDIIDNKRVLIDHGRKTVREAALSEEPKIPFGMGERKISKNAKPEQQAALRKLMGQMTQARLDPKREIKLGNATGETESVTVNGITIDCTWNMINRAGGPIGKVCLTRDSKVPMAPALRKTLLKMPLPAADKSDYLSYLRQLMAIEKSKLPVIIRLEDYVEGSEEPQTYEQWKVTKTKIAELGPDAFETPKGYSRPPR